jgi:hypothetical protein
MAAFLCRTRGKKCGDLAGFSPPTLSFSTYSRTIKRLIRFSCYCCDGIPFHQFSELTLCHCGIFSSFQMRADLFACLRRDLHATINYWTNSFGASSSFWCLISTTQMANEFFHDFDNHCRGDWCLSGRNNGISKWRMSSHELVDVQIWGGNLIFGISCCCSISSLTYFALNDLVM